MSSIEAPVVPEHVGDHRAEEQEHRVGPRRGLALDVDVDAARDDKQRANQRNEADVFDAAVQHALVGVQAEQVIGQGDRAERKGDLRVMLRVHQPRHSSGARAMVPSSSPKGRIIHGFGSTKCVTHPAYPTGVCKIRSTRIERCGGGTLPPNVFRTRVRGGAVALRGACIPRLTLSQRDRSGPCVAHEGVARNRLRERNRTVFARGDGSPQRDFAG